MDRAQTLPVSSGIDCNAGPLTINRTLPRRLRKLAGRLVCALLVWWYLPALIWVFTDRWW